MDIPKKREELLKAREQLLANLNAVAGALQLLDEVERDMEEASKGKKKPVG